jgi:hypothetical protein
MKSRKSLRKVVNHIDKAADSLIKVYASGNYGENIANNLYDVIVQKYPSMHGTLNEIRRGDGQSVTITSPLKSLDFLASMGDAVDITIKNFPLSKTTPQKHCPLSLGYDSFG